MNLRNRIPPKSRPLVPRSWPKSTRIKLITKSTGYSNAMVDLEAEVNDFMRNNEVYKIEFDVGHREKTAIIWYKGGLNANIRPQMSEVRPRDQRRVASTRDFINRVSDM